MKDPEALDFHFGIAWVWSLNPGPELENDRAEGLFNEPLPNFRAMWTEFLNKMYMMYSLAKLLNSVNFEVLGLLKNCDFGV